MTLENLSNDELDAEILRRSQEGTGKEEWLDDTVSLAGANFVIDAREASHGPYREQAQFAQILKGWFRHHKNWDKLPSEQKESLEMILLKMSRILSGTGNEPDHWIDMSGYAMLIYNLLTTGDHRGQ